MLSALSYAYPQTKPRPDYDRYITTYRDIAIREMKLYKIPASITLAQGIIESNCGLSPLAAEANNHFGIKCHKDWTGERYYYDDDKEQECFRKYNSAEESYRDHSLFLVNRPRYAALFSLDPDDYTGWAMGLKQAGYATNPEYPAILIRVIETNKLYQYDDPNFIPIAKVSEKEHKQPKHDTLKVGTTKDGSRHFSIYYQMPDPSRYELIRVSNNGRNVYENNGIPFIFAVKGDTWASIAEEFGVYTFQVYKDNDLTKMDNPVPGQIIYLEPKKRRCPVKSHKARSDETLYSISQLYGIKMKWLLKYNGLNPEDEIRPGAIVHLSKQR